MSETCQWQGLIARITIRPTIAAWTISIRDGMLFIECPVKDRDTGDPTVVHSAQHLPPWPGNSPAIEWVRLQLRRAMEHELDEMLLVDGERYDDPHIAMNEACPEHGGPCRIVSVSYSGSKPRRTWRCMRGDR